MSDKAGTGYTATIAGSAAGGPLEEVEATIKQDAHTERSEAAQLRLLRADLERRQAAADRERDRLLDHLQRTQETASRQISELLNKLSEKDAAMREQSAAMIALAGEAAGAAMAQLERAKITAELMHEQRKEPPASTGIELGKHAISEVAGLVKSVFSTNPQLSAKAGEFVAAITQAAQPKAETPSLGQLAAAREKLTDEEVQALCQRLGCSEEDLPVAELMQAAAAKGAASDAA